MLHYFIKEAKWDLMCTFKDFKRGGEQAGGYCPSNTGSKGEPCQEGGQERDRGICPRLPTRDRSVPPEEGPAMGAMAGLSPSPIKQSFISETNSVSDSGTMVTASQRKAIFSVLASLE